MFPVIFTHRATSHFGKIPKAWQKRILRAIEELKKNPWVGKKLTGKLLGNYSFRVWPYRIVYMIDRKKIVVIILDIAHRQGVYN